jgi:hypothetical protein
MNKKQNKIEVIFQEVPEALEVCVCVHTTEQRSLELETGNKTAGAEFQSRPKHIGLT